MHTYKQDTPLLFIDCLYTKVKVADIITTFFICYYIYFTFFRKPAQARPTKGKNNRETPRDIDAHPLSLLFIREDGPSAHNIITIYANLPQELS